MSSDRSATLTVDAIMALGPCSDYPRCRVTDLWAGRSALGWREIAALAIPPEDRLWVLLRGPWLSDIELRRLACRYVRSTPLGDGRTVWDLLTDDRSSAAVETAERWCDGQATDKELAVAWDAAWAVAWAAVGAAVGAWQIAQAVELLGAADE